MSTCLATVLAIVSVLPNLTLTAPTENDEMTHEQTFALTRDNLGRADPDALMYGFVPVWALVILFISAAFLIVSILSGTCYLLGCRNTATQQRKHSALVNY